MINDDTRLKNSISFMTAAILTIGVVFCLSFIKNELNMAAITATYDLEISNFVAEKSEKYQYIFGTLAFPLFYMAAQLFLSKKNLRFGKYENALDWCGFILMNLITFAVILYTPLMLYAFAFVPQDKIWTEGNQMYISGFIPLVIAYLIFIGYALYEKSEAKNTAAGGKKRFGKTFRDAAIYTIAGANLIFVTWLHITKTYYFGHYETAQHFDAYFYPVYKVFCGQTPLVDFDSLYGFYPYFLAPIFKLTGGISMLRFSIVMSVIIFVILLAMTVLIFKLCANKYIALLGTLAFSTAVAVLPMFYRQVYYLQYFPHRVLFPVMILIICVVTAGLKRPKARMLMVFAGYAVSAAALFWNIDTGIVALFAFAAFRLYLLLVKYTLKDKRLYLGAAGIFLSSVLSMAAALFTLVLITYERTGKLLLFQDILYSQTSFYGMGYFMLRMPLLGPWLLLIVLYAVSLAFALRRVRFLNLTGGEPVSQKAILRFLLPVIGMGIFSYYQGRSHFMVFTAVIWPGILLLVLKLEEYSQTAKETQAVRRVEKLKFFAIFFLLAILVGNFLVHTAVPAELSGPKNKTHQAEASQLTSILNAVKTVRKGNEPVDLITYYSAAVYCSLGDTRIANVPATIDWFTKADYQKVFDYLAKTENKVIIDKWSMSLMNRYEPEKLKAVLERFTLILQTDTCSVYTEKS